MANKIEKFKIHIEFDGEKSVMECKGRSLDIYAGISRFLADSTEGNSDIERKAIIYAICSTALKMVDCEKEEEEKNIEDIIAEIFKN